MKTKNDYAKDMNDPRWFDRSVTDGNVELPEWAAWVVFVAVPFVGAIALVTLIAGAVIEQSGFIDFGLFKNN